MMHVVVVQHQSFAVPLSRWGEPQLGHLCADMDSVADSAVTSLLVGVGPSMVISLLAETCVERAAEERCDFLLVTLPAIHATPTQVSSAIQPILQVVPNCVTQSVVPSHPVPSIRQFAKTLLLVMSCDRCWPLL